MRTRGLQPIYVLSVDDLISLPRWEHRIVAGKTQLHWRLADGAELADDVIAGVLNRLTWISPATFQEFEEGDREYAAQEFYALLLSSLTGLKAPVINAPTPFGLGGRWRTSSEWVSLASQAGLPVSPQPIAPHPATTPIVWKDRKQVLVLDDGVFNAPEEPLLATECRRFSQLAQTRLLGIDLERRDGNWTCVGASPRPDLMWAGPGFFDQLASLLQGA